MTDTNSLSTTMDVTLIPRMSKYVLIAVAVSVLIDILFGYLHQHYGFANKVMTIVFPPIGGGLISAAIFINNTQNTPTPQQAHQLALYSSGWLLAIGLSMVLFAFMTLFITNPTQINDRSLGLLLISVGQILKAGAVYLLYRLFCFGWAAKRMSAYEQRRIASKQ